MSRSDTTSILTLDNGLAVAYRHRPGASVEYCGLVVRAGSRDDGDHPGLAHFVEHTIFKGTQRRSSWHIINRMERVGGELNAYTTKEETVVYTAAPSGNADRAIELLADLALNSRFPDSELDKEREVVADEINSYLDSPADAVYDDFEELIFAGTPLAHNILGNAEALRTFDSELCRDYLRRYYNTSNVVLFYCGSAGAERVRAVAERRFELMPADADSRGTGSPLTLPVNAPLHIDTQTFDSVRDIGAHQAHTVMGAVVPGMYWSGRMALSLLTNIVGGPGMNSLLNIALREKRGYVYSVEASTGLYTDTGLFTIYFGCDPEDTEKCKALVRKQMQQLAETPLSPKALQRAKKQYLGQLAVATDNRENVAIATGRGALYHHRILSPRQTAEMVEAVTVDDLRSCAAMLTDLSSLTLT